MRPAQPGVASGPNQVAGHTACEGSYRTPRVSRLRYIAFQRRPWMSAFVCFICIVGWLNGVSGASATEVTLGQAARTSLTFGPVFAAMELGYFREEGIELKVLEFQGTSVLLPQIANKSVTIGFPNADPLILSRQPGRDPIPVKFFYNGARASIWELAVPADSQVRSLDDLRGKAIGVGALANGNVPILKAMLKEQGLILGKDYSLMATGDGPLAFRATLNGDVAAYNANDVFVAAFAQVADIRRLQLPEKYLNLFSNGFVANEDTIRTNPKLLAGFGRALTKGILVCEANPDFCVRTFWKLNPTLKPSGGSEAEILKKGRQLLDARMAKYTAFLPGTPRRFGIFEEPVWKDYIRVLVEGGELATGEIDPSTLYTNALVDQFNDFDAEEIQSYARTLR
jgi:NitT/TauT family transport system substrate-binding protein